MADDAALMVLMRAIAAGESDAVAQLLRTNPALASRPLGSGATRRAPLEFFLTECSSHIYSGDTALHVAALAFDVPTARSLVEAGAGIMARNRRGAEPLHAAARGGPGSTGWNPEAQVAMIAYLLSVGADVESAATGGVTPLHRAVRNRCSAAVRALLAAGADPDRPNDNGSTARTLAQQTTGRGGTGSPEAKAEQATIIELLSVGMGS